MRNPADRLTLYGERNAPPMNLQITRNRSSWRG
jgi:hypothetical protein